MIKSTENGRSTFHGVGSQTHSSNGFWREQKAWLFILFVDKLLTFLLQNGGCIVWGRERARSPDLTDTILFEIGGGRGEISPF